MLENEVLFPGAPSGEEVSAAIESLRGIVYAVALLYLDTGRMELLHGSNPLTQEEAFQNGTADEKIRQYILRCVPVNARERLYAHINLSTLRSAVDAGDKRLEIVYPRVFEQGTAFVSVSFTLGHDAAGGRMAIAMFQNISELIALRTRAENDTLTGLLNREAAESRIQEALDRLTEEDSGTFIFFDVDNLKRINDSRGHPMGDEALRRVAHALQSAFRRETDLVCRISGDEFVVWMAGVANAGLVERKIVSMHEMLGARRHDESAPPLTFSVGAAFARPGDTYSYLYSLTDEALYRAKDKGKGICVFVDRAQPGAQALTQTQKAEQDGRPQLLVVDDTAINRFVLRQIFEEEYGILEASDGREALNLLKTNGAQVKAVLLDMVMPGMDGEAFLRALRENAPSAPPVIVLSADANQDKVASALALGAADYICKPFIPSLLQRKVDNITALYGK